MSVDRPILESLSHGARAFRCISSWLVSEDIDNFVQMRIDVVGQLFELAPCPAEIPRLVGSLQQVAALPFV